MGIRSIRRAAATATFVLSAVIVPAGVMAQATIRGVLYDDVTGARLRGTVMLVDPASDGAVVHAATDSLGQFSLQIGSGVYQIAAVRPGFKSVLSAPIPLANGELLTVRVPIAQTGDPLHRIGVLEHVRPNDARAADARSADAGPHSPSDDGVRGRRIMGTGIHYDRKQFDKSSVNTLGEFLQTVPGFTVSGAGSASAMQLSRNIGASQMGLRGPTGTTCQLGWFLDGHRVDLPGRIDPLTDGLASLQLDAIEAVEVFRGPSEMPTEFASPDLRCGAVAIWTRKS